MFSKVYNRIINDTRINPVINTNLIDLSVIIIQR